MVKETAKTHQSAVKHGTEDSLHQKLVPKHLWRQYKGYPSQVKPQQHNNTKLARLSTNIPSAFSPPLLLFHSAHFKGFPQ